MFDDAFCIMTTTLQKSLDELFNAHDLLFDPVFGTLLGLIGSVERIVVLRRSDIS